MIRTIFIKELIDTLRDRRTLITMILIPVLIFPVVIKLYTGVSESFTKEAAEKTLKIGVVTQNKNNLFIASLYEIPEAFGKKELVFYSDTSGIKELINTDSLQLGLIIPPNLDENISTGELTKVEVLFNATNVGYKDRAKAYGEIILSKVKALRLEKLGVSTSNVEPLEIDYTNIASEKEVFGKLAGGILPYLFIAFGFLGCMYPAIDLFTGEKERGTIETLLTTPVARYKILIGKMGVVVLSGLAAATFALLGLYLSFKVFNLVEDPRLIKLISSVLTPTFIVSLYALLIPLTIFFAGIMIPVCVYAKTFKEAQSIITPLNIVLVLPAMIGFFPGIELDIVTACIPVVNVVLATKELIAGTLDFGLLGLSFVVMLTLALIAVFISYKRFDNEASVVAD
jgi:sodium transport system permease protein